MEWLSKLSSVGYVLRRWSRVSAHDTPGTADQRLRHLASCVIKMLLSWLGGMIVAFCFKAPLFRLVWPLLKDRSPCTISIVGLFLLDLTLSFYVGFVIAFPLFLWFSAEYLVPALKTLQRGLCMVVLLAGFLLYAAGTVIAYQGFLPKILRWLADNPRAVTLDVFAEFGRYLSVIAYVAIVCGTFTALPLVTLALSRSGIVTGPPRPGSRAYAWCFVLGVVAIVLSTPHPPVFLVTALPLLAIYELCVWIANRGD